MHTQKLRPQMGACEINKGRRPHDEGTSCCSSLRCWLIVWACMRLVVSVLWTIKTFMFRMIVYDDIKGSHYSKYMVLAFGIIVLITQLVEFSMLVTFIAAGIKRSAKLYRAYFRYCILTLIIYVIAVPLFYTFHEVNIFGDIYITYEFSSLIGDIIGVLDVGIIFGIAGILNICLEILLIYLIKKLINKYQYNEDHIASRTA